MSTVDQALETQLRNIQTKTGKSLEALTALVRASGLAKHGEIRAMLQRELGLGYGDANTLTHVALKAGSGGPEVPPPATGDQVLDEIYSGAKAVLRPIHDALMSALTTFGAFEVAPKKGYVSLRRKKQFAMVGPPANNRVEVGLNLKGVPGTDRLLALPPGGMCQYKVKLTAPGEVDAELLGWIRQAYDNAG